MVRQHDSAPGVGSGVPAQSSRLDSVNGAGLLHALRAGMDWLERNYAAVNALNVFPVPDGDTGTNMFLTMRAAYQAAAEAGDAPERAAGDVAARAAYGALMGARGNSGVILSQIFRGMAKALDGHPAVDAPLLATAFEQASAMAYNAVMKPMEGTLLTVSRGVAEAARVAADAGGDVQTVLDAALSGGRETLARTPEMLPLLREAGVVDAGGQGYVIILEGMRLHLAGRSVLTEELPAVVAPLMAFDVASIQAQSEEDEYGYCTNFLLVATPGAPLDFPALRAKFAAMGHSAVLVGDEKYLKAHIHTLDPGALLSAAVQYGSLHQLKIDNMDEQVETLEEHDAPAAPEPAETARIAVVAVAAGEGLSAVLRSLGAIVVRGGQTMNPSTQELLDAINAAPAESVIVLPNNGNIVMTAKQAAEMAAKPTHVVPTKSIIQGIASMCDFLYDADIESNVATMTNAAAHVHTGEVTRAVRDATIGGVAVKTGEVIGLLDDVLTFSGTDAAQIALDLLDRMGAAHAELITLYSGGGCDEASLADVHARVEAAYPDAAVEVVAGGQPHYDLVLSVE